MKKFLLLILIFISLKSFAQIKVKEGSFHKIDGYVMLDKEDHVDVNNAPMALIKISTENITAEQRRKFTFKGNAITFFDVQFEPGEIHLYISAAAATFIEIIHDDYGKTEYWFPETLKDFCGYEMVVQYIPIVPVQEVKPQNTYLVVSTDQDDAVIYIDGEYAGIKEASKSFAIGTTHEWKIECDLYHSESGSVTLNEKTEINKQLRPAHGFINVTSKPENGAIVFINNKKVGETPYLSDKLASGSYNVRVMKDMFHVTENTFIVNDGQTTNAVLCMTANFVNVTIDTDSQSDIYVDEEYKGKGEWTGRLSEGTHFVEVKKESHATSSRNINLVLGNDATFTIEAPKPVYGSLDVNSSPMKADIYIDGKHYGQTPNYINEILIGKHALKLVKQGYTTITKSVTIEEGETLSLNEKLVSQQTADNGQQFLSKVSNQIFTVKGVSFTMIKVEGGTFQMGATSEQGSDAESDEKPVHSVTLSDYYIGETEVTQELWETVMGSNPSNFKGSNKPVEKVSWNDCQEFIKKLNQLTGKNFRLPTEAEWEYAARGGNKSNGYKYSGSNTIENVAWYDDNGGEQTHDVKTKSPNELGIYDMSGNVMELCHDWYGDYSSGSQTNPTGPSSGSNRVSRGGSWYDSEIGCRVSYRDYCNYDNRYYYLGFRICLSQ